MKSILTFFCFVLLYNCISDSYAVQGANGNHIIPKTKNFKATFNDKTYDVIVECAVVNETSFKFKSDHTEIFDSNGDGLVISGIQDKKVLSFSIIDGDKAYSINTISSWNNVDNFVSGKGTMLLVGTTKQFDVRFELKH